MTDRWDNPEPVLMIILCLSVSAIFLLIWIMLVMR